MADLLRGTAAFQDFSRSLRVSLVEVSPRLRRTQWQALRCSAEGAGLEVGATAGQPASGGPAGGEGGSAVEGSGEGGSTSGSGGESDPPDEGVSGWNGARVSWHRSLEAVVPQCPTLYLAHEFLDALPVHQFQRTGGWLPQYCSGIADDVCFIAPVTSIVSCLHRYRRQCSCSTHQSVPRSCMAALSQTPASSNTWCRPSRCSFPADRGWCERLVDVAPPDSPLHLRLVLSPGATPAARALLPRRLRQLAPAAARAASALEVCPQVGSGCVCGGVGGRG
jgi:hypothetical protein